MGKKSVPEAPDMTRFADLSESMGNRALDQQDQQLAWAREQETNNYNLLQKVLGVQLPIMEQTFADAQKDRKRYETVFQPLEDSLVREAKSYNTPERQQFEQGRAVSDVNQAFDAQRRNAEANLASYGVDPTTLKAGALDVGIRTAQAATQAQAATGAQQNVENTGRALRADAMNIGRGMPSQVAASYSQSLGAGQSALGGANGTSANSMNLMNGAGQWGNMALNGYNGAANINSQNYQNQLAGWQARSQNSPWGAISQIGGAAMGGWAQGGFQMEEGGVVSENGALPVAPIPGSTDRKHVFLTPGEFVIPEPVVRFKGEEFFHKQVAKALEAQQAIQTGAPQNAG